MPKHPPQALMCPQHSLLFMKSLILSVQSMGMTVTLQSQNPFPLPPLHHSAHSHCVWHLCIICLSVSNETLTSSLHKGYCVPLIALNEPWALTKRLVLLLLTAEGPSALAPWRGKILSVSNVCTPSFSLTVIASLSLSSYMHLSPLEGKGVSFYFFRHTLLDHSV